MISSWMMHRVSSDNEWHHFGETRILEVYKLSDLFLPINFTLAQFRYFFEFLISLRTCRET